MRTFGYLFASIILAGYAFSAWAVLEFSSRTDERRGEVLMVLPGTGFVLLFAGCITLACVLIARGYLARWERIVLTIIALLGVALFPALFLFDF